MSEFLLFVSVVISTLLLGLKVLLFIIVLALLLIVLVGAATLLHRDAAFKIFTTLSTKALMRLQTLSMIIIAMVAVAFLCITLVNTGLYK